MHDIVIPAAGLVECILGPAAAEWILPPAIRCTAPLGAKTGKMIPRFLHKQRSKGDSLIPVLLARF